MDTFFNILAIIITSFIILIITILFTTLRQLIINYDRHLKTKISKEQYEIIQNIVKNAVIAGNQILSEISNDKKLNEVFRWSINQITNMGIPISDEELNIIIESTVNEQKKTNNLINNILNTPFEVKGGDYHEVNKY